MPRKLIFTAFFVLSLALVLAYETAPLAQQQPVRIDLEGAQNPAPVPGTPLLLAERGDTVFVAAVLAPFALDLQQGDRILAVDDKPIAARSDVDQWYEKVETGAAIRLTVVRDGEELIVEGEKPPASAMRIRGVISEDEARARGMLNDGPTATPTSTGKVVETLLYNDLPRLRKAAWRELARDAKGDGATAGAPDVTGMHYWFDDDAQMVWIRLDLAEPVPAKGFGANVVIDVDQDQETGSPWWGKNSSFTYEKYLTVWVIREGDRLSGVIGVGDATGAARDAYNNLRQGGIKIALDETGPAIILGVARPIFDDDMQVNLIAAVGTSTSWNDDIKDDGYVTISHP